MPEQTTRGRSGTVTVAVVVDVVVVVVVVVAVVVGVHHGRGCEGSPFPWWPAELL